jgi:hypothetical protein
MSAFKLARSGAYDESLALARTIWEITNIAALFVTDPTTFADWRNADERTRKDKYCPVNVRRALENSPLGLPLDRDHYAFLCAKGVHLTPTMPPQMYNTSGRPMIGGWFQEVGLCLCLAEIGHAFAFLGLCAVVTPNALLKLNDEQGGKVGEAAKALMRSLPQVWRRVNASFQGTCPEPVGDPFGTSS